MSKEKTGFVYIWYDSHRKMFYIGCHWGFEDDGYICSSDRMLNAHRKRPAAFKRRILSRVSTNQKDLFEEESRWLARINKDELGEKYYNIYNMHRNHWVGSSDARSIAKKSGDARRGKSLPTPPDRGAKISAAKQAAKLKRIEETGHGTSVAQQAAGITNGERNKGRKASPEARAKISASMLARSPELIEQIASKNRGQRRKFLYCQTCGVDTGSPRRAFCKDHRYAAMNASRAAKIGSKWYQN